MLFVMTLQYFTCTHHLENGWANLKQNKLQLSANSFTFIYNIAVQA
jgi:hypothetical protein